MNAPTTAILSDLERGGDRMASDAAVFRMIFEQIPGAVLVIDHELRLHRANSGREGVAMFDASGFDLVLTDQAMPDMAGDQVAAAIEAKEPGVPVFLVTGFGEIMKARGECPRGIDLIVPKPLTTSTLREIVARASAFSVLET